jgi:acetolactate synthase-1/2/3 large subunit
MEQLSGGEMIVRALEDEGVEYVFGYPGGAALHIYDAIFKLDAVPHILVRHEQAATHAADGYARATGKPGVVLVTSGPRCDKRDHWYCYGLHGFDSHGCAGGAGSNAFNR